MIIVGELINTSRKRIARAVENGDADGIRETARAQAAAGADYIDVNAGTFLEREPRYLPWLVETVQGAVDLPLCLDSPSPEALESALKVHRGEPMINSISLETERYARMLPVIKSRPCKVVALCMAQTAMPTTAQERIAAAAELIGRLTGEGIALESIFVDPLVQPISIDVRMGTAVLDAIAGIMDQFPGVHTICGLSNISFGLPERRRINSYFLSLAIQRGLTAAILDPTDRAMMAGLLTTRMLMGLDEYCADFIDAYEQGLFNIQA